MVNIKVGYGERESVLPAHVVNGGGPNLMGRDWLAEFEVSLSDLKVIHQTEPSDPPAVDSPGSDPLQEILLKYSDVFSDDLGCLKDRTVQLTVHDNAPPKFFKPRPVPFLLKDKIEQELNNLQEQGIISSPPGQPQSYLC